MVSQFRLMRLNLMGVVHINMNELGTQFVLYREQNSINVSAKI